MTVDSDYRLLSVCFYRSVARSRTFLTKTTTGHRPSIQTSCLLRFTVLSDTMHFSRPACLYKTQCIFRFSVGVRPQCFLTCTLTLTNPRLILCPRNVLRSRLFRERPLLYLYLCHRHTIYNRARNSVHNAYAYAHVLEQ